MLATTTESSTLRLPDRWIKKIFADLQGSYGSRFLDMWRTGQTLPNGVDVGLQNAMDQWGKKLAGFENRPGCIRKALTTLPPYPPTLPEFIALCRFAHEGAPKALMPPRMPPEQAAANIEQVAANIEQVAKKLTGGTPDVLGWARTPPAAGFRYSWEKAIVECVLKGDARFVPLLQAHVDNGVITSESAKRVIHRAAGHRSE